MSVADLSPLRIVTGNGTRGPFGFVDGATSVPWESSSHLYVVRLDEDGVATAQTEGTHYTVTQSLDSETNLYTGSITLAGSQDVLAAASGATPAERLIIYRQAPLANSVELANGTRFDSGVFTRFTNRVALLLQEQQRQIDSAIKLPIYESAAAFDDALQRANKIVGFDADGELALLTIAEAGSDAAQLVTEQIFTGDGSDTTFTLSNVAVGSESAVLVFVGGAVQSATDYELTASGDDTIVTFDVAPSNGAEIIVRVLAYASDDVQSAEASATAAAASQATASAAATAAAASALSASASVALRFTWDTGTSDADPGSGKLRVNHATIASATRIYLSETDYLGTDVAAIIATWDDSNSAVRAYIHLRKASNPAVFAVFSLTAANTDAGTYDKLTVAYLTGAGSFASGDVLVLSAQIVGDKGASGAGSGDVVAANNGSEYTASADAFLGNVGFSAFVLTLKAAANAAALRTLLSVPSSTEVAAAYQALDADLTALAALVTTAAGRSILTLTDPGADRLAFWDFSGTSYGHLALPSAMSISGTNLLLEEWVPIACSDETTALTTGTAKASFVFPYNVAVVGVGASVNTAGTAIQIDINDGGTSILSTKLTIDSGEKTSLTAATPAVISDAVIEAGAEVTVDIDSITGTWKGLKVWLIVRRTS